jgi:hypothetical protein
VSSACSLCPPGLYCGSPASLIPTGVFSHSAGWCHGQHLPRRQVLSSGFQCSDSLPCRHFFQRHGAYEFHRVFASICRIFFNTDWCDFVQVSRVHRRRWHDTLLHTLPQCSIRQHVGVLHCEQCHCVGCHALWCLCCDSG